jgi:uncharacterized glyoxalase superfamily protein PhnB
MPKITGTAAVLIVKDVAASVDYFRDAVGFEAKTWGDPPYFAICQRDGQRLMLAQAKNESDIKPFWHLVPCLWNAYFWVDDAAALFDELKQLGAKIDYELCTQPYNVREFGIQDLDGHDIGFGQVLGQ